MADNKQAGAAVGSGPTFATDEIGGIDYPRAKLVWGVDGTAVDASASNPIPVVQTGTPGLPTGAATAAKQDTGNTSLATLAGAVSGTEVQVDIVASAAIPVTDNGGTLSVDDGGGTLTVDGTVTANAGSGTFAVSAAALPLPSGASTAAKQPALGTAGTASADVISVQGIASMTPLLVNGSGVTQPVSDAGGSLSVDDNAGSLTVDAPVGTPVFVRLSDGSAAISTLPVSLASVPSHAVTNAGTFVTQENGAALTALQLIDNLVLAEDAAHSSGDPGLMPLAVRRDANTSLVGTDGDYAPLQVNADGSLKVAITAGAGSGGTSIADDAAFTPASTSITPVGGTYRSTLDAVDDGDAGAFAMTANRAMHVNLRAADGSELAAGDQYAEDAAHASGDFLTMAGAVRRDTAAVGSGTDGDNSTLNVNSVGRLWTTAVIDTALPAGTNNIGLVTDVPGTSGGWAISTLLSANTTNATSAKGSAGQVGGWYLYNANAAVRYLKLYNKATAPTVGTDVPVMTIPIPPGSAANVEFGKGVAFATGIAFAITTGVGTADTGAVAANEIIVNLLYK